MHDTQADRSTDVVPEILEREMRLIREAIALVASGASPRVILSSIRFGETLLDPAQRLAADAHVRVVPLWRSGEPNLTALRDLALRFVAERVEGQLEGAGGEQLPLITDRVLVLVDGSEASRRGVRRAAALAAAVRGVLIGVSVDTPESARQPFDRTRDLQETLDDAMDLGAEIIRIDARDIASGLIEVARARGATHIVLPYQEATGLRRVLERPLIDQLIAGLPEVEVQVVGARAGNGR